MISKENIEQSRETDQKTGQFSNDISSISGNSGLKLVRTLSYIALACWIVSLCLPVFIVQSSVHPWYGWSVLLFGMFFGWAVDGWAAYANIFFLYVLLKLFIHRPSPKASKYMMLFAMTVIFFRGVIHDEGSMGTDSVVSWGIGAVLWFTSLVMAYTGSLVISKDSNYRTVRVTLIVVGGSFIILLLTHITQRLLANDQENEIYLSRGMVFTTASFCGVPFNWPEKPVISGNQTVQLDTSLADNPHRPYLYLPNLINYQQGEFKWRIFKGTRRSSVQVKIRSPATPQRYLLQIKPINNDAVIKLTDMETQSTIYAQQLKTISRFGYKKYCPFSTLSWHGLVKGYDNALLRALGQNHSKPPKQDLATEIANQPCNIDTKEIDGIKGLRSWDKRSVILTPSSLRFNAGFCSSSYISLVYISQVKTTPSDLRPIVYIFNRKSLQPLAVFNNNDLCMKNECTKAPNKIVQSVKIMNNSVLVDTDEGKFTANHRYSP